MRQTFKMERSGCASFKAAHIQVRVSASPSLILLRRVTAVTATIGPEPGHDSRLSGDGACQWFTVLLGQVAT